MLRLNVLTFLGAVTVVYTVKTVLVVAFLQ